MSLLLIRRTMWIIACTIVVLLCTCCSRVGGFLSSTTSNRLLQTHTPTVPSSACSDALKPFLTNRARSTSALSMSSSASSKTNTAMMKRELLHSLQQMSLREVFNEICNYQNITTSTLYSNVRLLPTSPVINRFVIANPIGFLRRESWDISKNYLGFPQGTDGLLDYCLTLHQHNQQQATLHHQTYDIELKSLFLQIFSYYLPIIYIAESNNDFGTLGYCLNARSMSNKALPPSVEGVDTIPAGATVGENYPSLRKLRDRPVYLGGQGKKGNSFVMIHRKVGFPENRPFKVLPAPLNAKHVFNFPRMFFSTEYAMANELCLTNDAKPNEFKFFNFATVWSPSQLDQECNQHDLWLTLQAPSDIFFDDDEASLIPNTPPSSIDLKQASLYQRLLRSLPKQELDLEQARPKKKAVAKQILIEDEDDIFG